MAVWREVQCCCYVDLIAWQRKRLTMKKLPSFLLSLIPPSACDDVQWDIYPSFLRINTLRLRHSRWTCLPVRESHKRSPETKQNNTKLWLENGFKFHPHIFNVTMKLFRLKSFFPPGFSSCSVLAASHVRRLIFYPAAFFLLNIKFKTAACLSLSIMCISQSISMSSGEGKKKQKTMHGYLRDI